VATTAYAVVVVGGWREDDAIGRVHYSIMAGG